MPTNEDSSWREYALAVGLIEFASSSFSYLSQSVIIVVRWLNFWTLLLAPRGVKRIFFTQEQISTEIDFWCHSNEYSVQCYFSMSNNLHYTHTEVVIFDERRKWIEKESSSFRRFFFSITHNVDFIQDISVFLLLFNSSSLSSSNDEVIKSEEYADTINNISIVVFNEEMFAWWIYVLLTRIFTHTHSEWSSINVLKDCKDNENANESLFLSLFFFRLMRVCVRVFGLIYYGIVLWQAEWKHEYKEKFHIDKWSQWIFSFSSWTNDDDQWTSLIRHFTKNFKTKPIGFVRLHDWNSSQMSSSTKRNIDVLCCKQTKSGLIFSFLSSFAWQLLGDIETLHEQSNHLVL